MASYGGHKEVVEILLAAQANIVLKTKVAVCRAVVTCVYQILDSVEHAQCIH